MNFTTDLPKSRPFVTYIVASAVKCEKFFPNSKNEGPSFRMHAVILNQNGLSSYREKINKKDKDMSIASTTQTQEKEYILCHIRKIDTDYKLSKSGKRNDENIEEMEKIEEVKDSLKSKKIKLEPNQGIFLQKEGFLESNTEEMKEQSPLNPKMTENLDFSTRKNLANNPEDVKFRKMGLNMFQMFCVNQVIERDFSKIVNDLCKMPEKKRENHKNFFPEVIHEELNKKEETNNVRDYAKMFNLMS